MPHKPIAWLMRESGPDGQSPRIMSGRMWVTREAALAAAKRMSGGRWWVRTPVPVFEPTPEQLRDVGLDADTPPR